MIVLPIVIVIDDDNDKIAVWTESKKELLHDLGVEAASYMINDSKLQEQTLISFSLSPDEEPYADAILNRRDMATSLAEAEAFYVEEELFEKAAIARNLLSTMNIK